MGTIVMSLLGVIAAVLFWRTDTTFGLVAAIAATAVVFWSAGVMHNHATERAFGRHRRLRQLRLNEGASAAEISALDSMPIHPSHEDIAAVPNGITRVNMAASFVILCLLIWAITRSL